MSIFERSIAITVVNALPDATLTIGQCSASAGPVPAAASATVPPGGTTSVSASNGSGGCTGAFVLSGGPAPVTVQYDHPMTAGATTVAAQTSAGMLWATDAASYSGHDVTARLSLYQGVPANGSGGYAVPLQLLSQPPVNNAQDFVNSLFGPNMRSAAQVEAAYGGGSAGGFVTPADFTGGQMAGFVQAWQNQWLNGGDPRCAQADAALLALLAKYLGGAYSSTGALTMWVPQLAWQSGTSPSVFALSGYRAFPFHQADGGWNAATVSAFLTLLAAGGHFAAICAAADLPAGVSLTPLDSVLSGSGLPTSHDVGNSHYASVVNETGLYYLGIGQDFAPPGCGLLLAFLVGRTVNNPFAAAGTYNCFMQLEGWQASLTGSRHNADYATYKETLWNISTFGACPYSEKRATTIFLAPSGWSPQLYQTTLMMPYVGAYATAPGTPQSWLNPSLATVPAGTPPLPARYIA